MSRVHRDVTMLTDEWELCSIPAKELKVVVRGYTIRIGNMTWLRRVGVVVETTTARAIGKEFEFVVHAAVNDGILLTVQWLTEEPEAKGVRGWAHHFCPTSALLKLEVMKCPTRGP